MAERPRMLFNAFHMFCVSHHAQGLWAEPGSRQLDYLDLQTWIDLAQLLERGGFDTVFFADVLAPYETYRGSRNPAVFEGMQFPVNDPSLLIPTLAHHTDHLGYVMTQNVLQEHPYAFARKMSTLDHLTRGRVGWNIVTTFLPGAGRNLGFGGLPDHAERYARAEDFVAAVYKLWEASWEDDAVVRDRERRQYTDPAKVHEVPHDGPYYQVVGPHLSEPSPQRTPLLFQAGVSPTGRSFAGRHAEALFVNSVTPAEAAPIAADVRAAAVAAGRGPDRVKLFAAQAFVVGSTEAEARRLDAELLERQTVEGNLARMSAFLFHDFGRDDPDEPVAEIRRRGATGIVKTLVDLSPREDWTLGELVRWFGNQRLVGTPEQVADGIAAWQDAGVDGLNVQYVVSPGTFEDFVEHVAPVLRARGLLQPGYREGTLREKFFDGAAGPRLPEDHPAAALRAAARVRS